MHCFDSFLLQAMFFSLQIFAFKGTVTPGPLRLFTASVQRPLAGRVADISGSKDDEQVTDYSHLWLSWGGKIPNKLMNLKPDILTQTWT